VFQTHYAWDVLQFNLSPLVAEQPAFFASPEVRQAVALCTDRQALVEQLSGGQMQVADLYVPPVHPLYNPDATQYAFDPQAASDLLTQAGWLDTDNNPSTPRIAQGVEGVVDGAPFAVQYLVAEEAERQAAAKMLQADLQGCGIQAEIISQPAEEYLAPGPDGAVFGRKYDLAQFAWMAAVEPPCSLYLTSEIPGPYPDYPKGWGESTLAVTATRIANCWMLFTRCMTCRNMLKSMRRHRASLLKTCLPCRSIGITG
jgi:peptide/nickel transport system substrate-binding protein